MEICENSSHFARPKPNSGFLSASCVAPPLPPPCSIGNTCHPVLRFTPRRKSAWVHFFPLHPKHHHQKTVMATHTPRAPSLLCHHPDPPPPFLPRPLRSVKWACCYSCPAYCPCGWQRESLDVKSDCATSLLRIFL